MEEFARWWMWKEGNFIAKDIIEYPGLPKDEFLQALAGAEFKAYMEEREDALRAIGRSFEADNYKRNTGFTVEAGQLTFAFLTFNATYAQYTTKDEANEWHDRWQALYDEHVASIGGYQTSRLYLFMITQNELFEAAVKGVVLSLLVAWIVLLLNTKNLIIATLGLVNIFAITVVFVGLIPLLGWELGSNESIFLIAVVGLSVDYTVHLLHSYKGHSGTQEEKAQKALGEMGISVVNSAITTLLAAACLFFCWFWFFVQYGGFLFFVILFSILMSIFFLIPLLLVVGPVDGKGDVEFLRGKKLGDCVASSFCGRHKMQSSV